MKYLVLGPAAMGYFSLLGYIKSIEDKLKDVEEISGASAGAILALFLSVGLSVDEIVELSFNFDVPEFVKIKIGYFFNKFGFVDVDPIRSKLIEYCKGNPTFKELNKKIYVSAFCLNTHTTEYFSVDTHPDMYVIDAVCMSISIPFIFTANKYNDYTYVDGGLVERFPYTPFLDKKLHQVHIVTLKNYKHFQETIDTPMHFLHAIIYACLNNRQEDKYKLDRVQIDIGEHVDVFNFDMTHEEKLKLYMTGLKNLSAYIYGIN